MLNSFDAQNSNLSAMQKTQGKIGPAFKVCKFFSGSTYLCWAFSCASMLRTSCRILIKKLFLEKKIDRKRKEKCLEFINGPEVHQEIRNLIAMILLPKKLHENDESQAAYLRAGA